MNKYFFLLSFFFCTYTSWSQTMNIHFNSGKTVQYNMKDIKYIELGGEKQNNQEDNKDVKGNSSLSLVTSTRIRYVLLSYFSSMVTSGDNVNGNLTDDGNIYWYMTPEDSWSPLTVSLSLKKKMSISDFPKDYDLGDLSIVFASFEYEYYSGSVKVINNDGKSFTLEFTDYKAFYITNYIGINGTLYVQKESNR